MTQPDKYFGEYKVPGGKLVATEFEVSDDKIKNFALSGDFFLEPDELLFVISGALEGAPAGMPIAFYRDLVSAALPEDAHLIGVSSEAIAIAVRRAFMRASRWRDLEWEVIVGDKISPVLNVALDEVLLREVGSGRRGPTMRVWDWDEDAVVIGSFQSVKNEVNEQFARELDTTVVRRISGGGAMYMQPEASISYSIYVPTSFVADMSFEQSYEFLDDWVLETLHLLGVDAVYKPLNDIAGPAGKIGGAAQKRLASGAVLHHVTMAYDMDAEKMTQVLRIGQEKLSDKGTKSAAKRVDPLRSQTGLERAEIVAKLVEVFVSRHSARTGEFRADELAAAHELVAKKFSAAEWTHRVP